MKMPPQLQQTAKTIGLVLLIVSTVLVGGIWNNAATAAEVPSGEQPGLTIEKVFPNPFSSRIYLELRSANGEEVEVELVTITGEVVSSQIYFIEKRVQKVQLDILDNIPSGIYMLRIKSAERTVVRKLVHR